MAAETRAHATGESAFAAAARAIGAHRGQTPTQAVREFRGLTQSDLAKRSGVSVGTINALENGESPDTLLLDSVAAALQVPKSLLKQLNSTLEDPTESVS